VLSKCKPKLLPSPHSPVQRNRDSRDSKDRVHPPLQDGVEAVTLQGLKLSSQGPHVVPSFLSASLECLECSVQVDGTQRSICYPWCLRGAKPHLCRGVVHSSCSSPGNLAPKIETKQAIRTIRKARSLPFCSCLQPNNRCVRMQNAILIHSESMWSLEDCFGPLKRSSCCFCTRNCVHVSELLSCNMQQAVKAEVLDLLCPVQISIAAANWATIWIILNLFDYLRRGANSGLLHSKFYHHLLHLFNACGAGLCSGPPIYII
jgi:hypothetical protein